MTKKNDMLVFRAADLVVRAILRLMPPTDTAIHLALSWGYRFDPKPHTFRLRSGLLFRYPKTDFIPLLLSYVGTFEPGVIKLLRQLLKRGDTVLDVGANIGFHTLECWNAGMRSAGTGGSFRSKRCHSMRRLSGKTSR